MTEQSEEMKQIVTPDLPTAGGKALLNQCVNVDVQYILIDPTFNCRGEIGPADVVDLVESIKRVGLQQPIVIQKYEKDGYLYRVVMGHRRLTALKVLGKTQVPAILREVSDAEAVVLNLVENLERKNLTFMQEARSLQKFVGWRVADVARMLNQAKAWVQIRISALKLPKNMQDEIERGAFSQEQIRHICGIVSPEKQYEAIRLIKDAKLKSEKFEIPKKVKSLQSVTKPPKRQRTNPEILRCIDVISGALDYNLATRALAWCAGNISDLELLQDIGKEAELIGKDFDINTSLHPEPVK